jgi:SAM-dependent methyltransferase
LLAALRRRRLPVRFGSLRSLEPIGADWGYDRGTPVDRWYIERFLEEHRRDISGRVLEVKDRAYTDRFGAGVVESGVLDIDAGNPVATHVADLASAEGLPAGWFDCFVLTQTLQYVFDLPAAIAHVHRILRPGGAVLATLPTLSRISPPTLTDCWRFTPLAAQRLFAEDFGAEQVSTVARGNILAQVAFLHGLAAEELEPSELETDDPLFPLLVCVRARKAGP